MTVGCENMKSLVGVVDKLLAPLLTESSKLLVLLVSLELNSFDMLLLTLLATELDGFTGTGTAIDVCTCAGLISTYGTPTPALILVSTLSGAAATLMSLLPLVVALLLLLILDLVRGLTY